MVLRLKPKKRVINVTKLSSDTTSAVHEPSCFSEDIKHLEWRASMSAEISVLNKHDTWELVSKPPGANVVRNKWVYKVKRNLDGSIERYKARLIVKGYTQQPGINYTAIFSPIVKATTV